MEFLEVELFKSAQILDVLSSRRECVTPQSSGLEVLTVGALKRDLIHFRKSCSSLHASNTLGLADSTDHIIWREERGHALLVSA